MNILFDQTEAQALFFNGAAQYAQTVFFKMVSSLEKYPDVHIYSLYHSDKTFKYEKLSPDKLKGIERVSSVDYKGKSLRAVVIENKIDLLFITCAQSFCDLSLGDINNLPCKIVCVIHDLFDEEMSLSKAHLFQYFTFRPLQFFRYYLSRTYVRLRSFHLTNRTSQMLAMLTTNDVDIITVSEYSKNSIIYIYPQIKSQIHVWASPLCTERIDRENIDNKELADLVKKGKKYFLLLSADRIMKNGDRMIKSFHRYVTIEKKDYYLVTVGYGKKEFDTHIALPFLKYADLLHAYKNCHALLYPSMFEGYGYPPLEAMSFGKPVLCSFSCSMPEVLEDAPIYFNPIYETDMFSALIKFDSSRYDDLAKRSKAQYEIAVRKQNSDLQCLVDTIMNGELIKKKS